MSWTLLATTLSLAFAAPQQVEIDLGDGGGTNPILQDRTGIDWAPDFAAARERARTEDRLLLILADNYQPTDDGGFGFENFRLMYFLDERVVGLINRRFVPYYFNTFEMTAAFDQGAKDFVVREKKSFGEEEQTFSGGIPILMFTPAGKLVGELKADRMLEQFVEALQRTLKKNAAYAGRSKAEKAVEDPLGQARLAFELGNLELARKKVRKAKGDEAALFAAKLARLDDDWRGHDKILRAIRGSSPVAEIERARRELADGRPELARKHLEKAAMDAACQDEAGYLLGIAAFRQGNTEGAAAIWEKLIEGHPQNPWIYRADWARSNALQDPRSFAGGASPGGVSLLGRMFYFVRCPDLSGGG